MGIGHLIIISALIRPPEKRLLIYTDVRPYVYAQMIAGKDAPTHGEAKNSWLTGTAAWNYFAITQFILGIHPSYKGSSLRRYAQQSGKDLV